VVSYGGNSVTVAAQAGIADMEAALESLVSLGDVSEHQLDHGGHYPDLLCHGRLSYYCD